MTQTKPTVEELQELLAKQAEEIERLARDKKEQAEKLAKLEKEKHAKKPKDDTIYSLVNAKLEQHQFTPDVFLWFDLLVHCVDTLRAETKHVTNPEVFAEYNIDFKEALRVLGYLKNSKIFGATYNSSKIKYVYGDKEDLDANGLITAVLTDKNIPVEPVLNEEDF